ncbi:F0F1 ATP synthase subunit A [Sinimarinibacterium sp. CAU 1509]|uniref:F0F1 ATP synthase subunit A n=1 Tax=Sinimarinibacterium sp. CAU 1509 TaxID=2562283 RepID=UPI0010AD3163|nr:F0F1 ATP synthase subunit A [Sinimarinibacterium sp. CAU 1509]TJY63102.1 F0F1 ATP synthase subunit A [Sinimarinibacterium sp. CAU 1509]
MNSPLESTILFHIGPIAVAQAVVTTWALMALMTFGFWLACRRLRVEAPGRVQVLLEWYVELIQQQIRDTMQCPPRPFLPLIATLFLFIAMANLSALVPGVEPPTATLETDAALALIVFVTVLVQGVRSHGLLGYLRSFASPGWFMLPLNLLEQITRTFSLMVRLFGNIMSGAFVIGIVLSLTGLFVPIPFMALDILTGLIQAYIFTVLAMVFIGAALHEGG